MFYEHLRYEQTGETPGCYGGNVASMSWTVCGDAKPSQNAFHNSYDGLGRLASVKYVSGTDSYANFARYEYDALGNIVGLQQQGVLDDGSIGDIDKLTYSYNGNQLVKVDDTAEAPTYSGAMHFVDNANEEVEYKYDANGNMTADLNNQITSVSYNSLNLPSKITYKSGSYITYTYTADGEKIRVDYYKSLLPSEPPVSTPSKETQSISAAAKSQKMHSGPPLTSIHTYTEYCGNNIFENGELKQTLFDGGYVTYADGEPEYHFYVRDHQGNNRLIIREDGLVEQVNDYTPFGALMKNQFTATSDQRYKYNGKELDRMFGLDLYDYGARFYDARIARWQTLDPLCEKYYSISPYVYCANNPILYVDPDGCDIVIRGKSNTRITFTTDLIDINVNASILGINWGGNYVFKGDDLLSAALDIAGLIDPTGIADISNASLQASNGDLVGAFISGISAIPYVGDVAKSGKIGKDINIIQTAIKSSKSAKSTKSIANSRRAAVRKAWKDEQQMVKEKGYGIKTWSKAELEELLKTGKVKGYEGHHINNVKHHPDLAGNPNNVIFANRKEHLALHGGNFRNETHGKLLKRNTQIK
jgi:RHS repeat-associated protein